MGAEVAVSIVSGCRLDDRSIVVQSPARAKNFSCSLFVQTGSGPTQPSVQWVTGVPSLGKARPGRDADHSPPSSAEVVNE
jgi:hypothetical protein